MVATLTTTETISRIPVLAAETSWNTLGEALDSLHDELIDARDAARDAEDGKARDAAGFAAKGVAAAIESFGLVTSLRGHGTETAWTDLARILSTEISGGVTESVREGLAKALSLVNTAHMTYRATFNR